LSKSIYNIYRQEKVAQIWATSAIFIKLPKENNGEKIHPIWGRCYMITIFCDFYQFSATNWRFSLKPMLVPILLQKQESSLSKNAIFSPNILAKNVSKS
jgi:hypothetical protein